MGWEIIFLQAYQRIYSILNNWDSGSYPDWEFLFPVIADLSKPIPGLLNEIETTWNISNEPNVINVFCCSLGPGPLGPGTSDAQVMGVCFVLWAEAQARASWSPTSDSARWWCHWPGWAFSLVTFKAPWPCHFCLKVRTN